MVAALYVHPAGPYVGRAGVDAWTEDRDARLYAGPWPVVAHPPCATWSRLRMFARPGGDGGTFAAALDAVRRWGGVLEHPASSHAWSVFGLPVPRTTGWTASLFDPGLSTVIAQSAYGHKASKMTWLYYVGAAAPDVRLDWRRPRGTHCIATSRGKHSLPEVPRVERHLSPPAVADLLLHLARGSGGPGVSGSAVVVR